MILAVAFGACLLFAPAALNGFPFLFFDTRAYYNMGEGVFRLIAEMLFSPGNAAEPALLLDLDAPTGAVDQLTTNEISLARSPFYGVFLYTTDLAGPWLFAVIQVTIMAWLLWLVVARSDFGGRFTYLWLMLVATCTVLPFFATYAMPDIWAGMAVLIVFLLTTDFQELRPVERIGVALLLVFALLVHGSHVLLVAGLLAVVGARDLIHPARKTPRAGMAVVATALAVAIVGYVTVMTAAKLRFGVWPMQPPWLMARVIEDGPGLRLIAAECAEGTWQVCRFADRISGDSQAFLWSDQPEDGVFFLLSPDDKRRLASEELAFVVKAVAREPVMQLRASAANWLEQLSMFGRYEFATATELPDLVPLYAPHWAAPFAESGAARGTWPWSALSILDYVIVMLAIILVIWFTVRSRTVTGPAVVRARRFLGVVVAALAINALVCGVLSDPHHRYQARVIWLLPAAALLAVGAVRRPAG